MLENTQYVLRKCWGTRLTRMLTGEQACRSRVLDQGADMSRPVPLPSNGLTFPLAKVTECIQRDEMEV